MSGDFYRNGECYGPDFELLNASSSGDVGLIRRLLLNGANIEQTSERGWRPLMCAAHYGHYNIVKLLIEHGANVEAQEWILGRTALMMASSSGHTRCIEILVDQGKCQIDQRDFEGRTAAYYAIHSGHGRNKIIARLLKIQPRVRTVARPIKGRFDSIKNQEVKENSNSNQAMKNYSLIKTPQGNNLESNEPLKNEEKEIPKIKIDYTSLPDVNGFSPYLHFPSTYMTPTIGEQMNIKNANRNKRPLEQEAGPEIPVLKKPVGEGSAHRLSNELERQTKPRFQDGTPNLSFGMRKEELEKANNLKLPKDLDSFLEEIELAEYKGLFAHHKIDLHCFLTLEDKEFENLGIPLGHRRKFWLIQTKLRGSNEICNTQERFLADWLFYEMEALRCENQELKLKIKQMEAMCDTVISLRSHILDQ